MWDDSPAGRKSHAEALAAFPYEHLEVPGAEALAKWERLKAAGRGVPVVIGDDEAFTRVIEPFRPDWWPKGGAPVVEEVLARADGLRHPEDLVAFRQADSNAPAEGATIYRDEKTGVTARLITPGTFAGQDEPEPPLGEWPDVLPPPDPTLGLTVARDLLTGRPYDKVHIVLLPTDDPSTIPAYLGWGGWNENPPPEYHVAALRSWHARYGAELVGLGSDTMNIRVARRPQCREEALALAREQYSLCADVIEQGSQTFSALGASLASNDWWFLWWD